MHEPAVRNTMSPHVTTAFSVCLFGALLSIGYALIKQSELDSLLKQGIDDLHKHKYESALAQLSDAVKKQPKSARAFYYLGIVEARMANYDSARHDIETAEKLGMPKPAVAMVRSAIDFSTANYETAAAYLNDLPASVAQSDLASLYRGMREKNSQRYAEALVDLNVATGSKNKNIKAAAFHERAYIRFKQGSPMQAIADLTKSLETVPTVLGYQHRADMERKLAHYDKAVADYTRAVHLSKAPAAELYLWRGHCQSALKHHSEAVDDYRMALHLQPALNEAKIGLKQAYTARESHKSR